MSRRRSLIAANWKMHFVAEEARANCRALCSGVSGRAVDVLVFPSHPLLPVVADELVGTPIEWGGQDLHPEASGAHTGDVSGAQLADAGCRWVLVGHSERRRDHGEGDGLVAAKLAAARTHGLAPILCVGETAAERQAGRTFEVLARQLEVALEALSGDTGDAAGDLDPARFAVAYEPVWAIGTGDTATPEIAQEAHRFLRRTLAETLGEGAAAALRLLYGGSVKPANAASLAAEEDIDGFLVGGASLDPEKFLGIIGCSG